MYSRFARGARQSAERAKTPKVQNGAKHHTRIIFIRKWHQIDDFGMLAGASEEVGWRRQRRGSGGCVWGRSKAVEEVMCDDHGAGGQLCVRVCVCMCL